MIDTTHYTTLAARRQTGLPALAARLIALFECIPYWFIALVTRLSIAGVFWRSGQTKLEGWRISDTAIDLFRDEYRLPLVDPVVAAWLATLAEHLFPALLVVGVESCFSALEMLILTVVIEIFVYGDAWPTHGTWAACFLILMAKGPGGVSLDHLIAGRSGR